MERAIEAGDVVRLKSGGPLMTVTKVAEDDTVTVCWFPEGSNQHTDASFTRSALSKSKVSRSRAKPKPLKTRR